GITQPAIAPYSANGIYLAFAESQPTTPYQLKLYALETDNGLLYELGDGGVLNDLSRSMTVDSALAMAANGSSLAALTWVDTGSGGLALNATAWRGDDFYDW